MVDNVGDKFLIATDHSAPNWKVALYDPANSQALWKDVLPEKPEALEDVSALGGKLFVTYLKDVANHVYVYSSGGELENEIALPGVGTATGFVGSRSDISALFLYSSLNYPTTVFRFDLLTKKTSVFKAPEIPGFHPEDYETKEVFYNSKDGTRPDVPGVQKGGEAGWKESDTAFCLRWI